MSLSKHPSIIASQGVLANTKISYIWDLSGLVSLVSTDDTVNMITDCVGHDISDGGTQLYGISTTYDTDVDIYYLTNPYELATASTNDFVSIASGLQDITFNGIGDKCMTLHDNGTESIYSVWDVVPPFDFLNGRTFNNEVSVGPTSAISCEMVETKIIAVNSIDNSLMSWNMYDYDTSTLHNYQANSSITGINDFAINQIGTQLVTVGNGVFSLYTFGTPYNIQALTHVYDIAIPDDGFDKTITVRNDGTTVQVGDYSEIKTYICDNIIPVVVFGSGLDNPIDPNKSITFNDDSINIIKQLEYISLGTYKSTSLNATRLILYGNAPVYEKTIQGEYEFDSGLENI